MTPDAVAYELIGQVMAEQAGSFNYFEDVTYSTVNYRYGPVGTEVRPLPGRFMDWAYAAGWDRESNGAVVEECQPYTYDLDDDGINFRSGV